MTDLIASICLSASLFALTLSVISLTFHWIKSRKNPDIDQVWQRIQSLKVEHLDLLDKVEHWRKRDNVRNARAKQEERVEVETTPADVKASLRLKATQAGLGVVGRR